MTNHESPNNFAFSQVLFLGRDFTEYQKMFNLNPQRLKGKKILDCASGPSSFAVEASMYGMQVTSCDPMYATEGNELAQLCRVDVERVGERQVSASHLFEDYALSPQFKERKKKSRDLFLRDYPSGVKSGRYIHGELPMLPFKDKAFDVALCANFLFLYTPLETGGMLTEDRFNYEFHCKALRELIRLSPKEVRIYPIKGPHKEHHHHYIDDMKKDPRFKDLEFIFEEVTYRDIRNAHALLLVRRK